MSEPFDVNAYWLRRGRSYADESRLGEVYHRRQETHLIERLRAAGLPGPRVLELGCGYGRITRLLSEHFPESNITALDFSPDQLAQARTRCADRGNVRFLTYDFYSGDPLPGGPYDTTLAVEVFLHHPPDLIRSLLARIQRASSLLVHIDWYEPWSAPLAPHVWIHPYKSLHRRLGWQTRAWPFPEKTEGKQQVLFFAAARLPDGCPSSPADADPDPAVGSPSPSRDAYEQLLAAALNDVAAVIPNHATVLLADNAEWGFPQLPGGRGFLPFPSQNGEFWGAPVDDDDAWNRLEDLRQAGAEWLVIAWNAFWWLDHYTHWHQRLRDAYPCLLENERLLIFQLANRRLNATASS